MFVPFVFDYKFLDKRTKNTIDLLEESDGLTLLDSEEYVGFVSNYDVLADLVMGGYQLNQDQLAYLILPFKIWGKDSAKNITKMHEMRRKWFVEEKKRKEQRMSNYDRAKKKS